MPAIIGIDLGTTNTAVAVLEAGRPRVIEDDRGYKVLPSVISSKGEGRFVVGQAAHSLILTRPDRTVYATKRLMGRRFDSPEVQRVKSRIGYNIREAPDGGVEVQVGDAWMTPSEVAAVVLQVARGIAERALGQPVEEAVITVPAHFNHAQRKATLEAAQIAGLQCERLLNEPTAAALAYGHRRNADRTLVIFDLGGGTFDVSVLKLSAGLYEILSTNGDTFLGGEDFDYRVVDWLADRFKASHGVDLRQDKNALQRLKDAGERAKCELSFSDRANIIVPHAAPGQNLEAVLTRTQLEDLTRDLVHKCVSVARDAVAEAGLGISDVDEVILVGGQTRMPLVREAVSSLFGREPSRTVHPEEAVAIGAAVHGASLGDVEGTPAVLLDVTPFDLGIDSAGGTFSVIVQRNARVPCSETRFFATLHDNQTEVKVTVRQGESRVAEENEFLGEFVFDGLPPAPRMQTKVAVTFRIDTNGMLHVTAAEPVTGEKRHIAIRNYAQRDRNIVGLGPPAGAAPSRVAEAVVAEGAPAAAAESKARVKKKKGLLESIFGKAPVITPKPAPVVEAVAPVEAPPVIAPLPTPVPVSPDTLEALPGDDLQAVEPEEDALMQDVPLESEDLYDPATASASFGLAGSAQAGASSPAQGDPFGDLDASDLFSDAAEDDEDPPTNPGGRAAPAAGRPAPQMDLRPAPASGLLFEALLDEPVAIDESGFTMDDPPVRPNSPDPLKEEDLFGFAFSDLEGDVAADGAPQPARDDPFAPSDRAARLAGEDPAGGFAFPMPDDEPFAPKKPRKPARVKLHYRDRDALVAEYRDNLRRGGATIRTERPLSVGRECLFEVHAPGLVTPLQIPARVTRIVHDGMEVVYQLEEGERRAVEDALRG